MIIDKMMFNKKGSVVGVLFIVIAAFIISTTAIAPIIIHPPINPIITGNTLSNNNDSIHSSGSSDEGNSELTTFNPNTCEIKYLNKYRCNGYYVEQRKQNTDCNFEWINSDYCTYGCKNGQCKEKPKEEVKSCNYGYLDNYRCNGNYIERKYQYSNCSFTWLFNASCSYGCSDGKCIQKSLQVSPIINITEPPNINVTMPSIIHVTEPQTINVTNSSENKSIHVIIEMEPVNVSESEIIKSINSQICIPNEVGCNGNYLKKCFNDGSAWDNYYMYCNKGCLRNGCISQSNIIEECTSNGLKITYLEMISESEMNYYDDIKFYIYDYLGISSFGLFDISQLREDINNLLNLEIGAALMTNEYVSIQHQQGFTKEQRDAIINFMVKLINKISTKSEQVKTCTEGYLNEYRCNGNSVERKWITSECRTAWLNLKACDYRCSNGRCISEYEYYCSYNIFNCEDFNTQTQAQAMFEFCGGIYHDIHYLDGDDDGRACELLP